MDSSVVYYYELGVKCISWPNGHQEWYTTETGFRHRIDGPAITFENGTVMWWVHDTNYTLDEYMDRILISKEERVMFKLKWGGRTAIRPSNRWL